MQSLKQKICPALFLVAVFFILSVRSVLASSAECDYSKEYNDPKTIYVEATGSDDQNVINQAIQQLDGTNKISVFLKEGKYVITDSINMKEYSILEGDQNTVLTIEDHAGWTVNKPLITAPKDTSNMEVKCFQIDGNYYPPEERADVKNYSAQADSCYRPLSWNSDFSECEEKTDDRLLGRGYYDMVHWTGGENLSVHDMYMHDSAGDGLRIDNARMGKFYDNLVYKLGHDAVAYYNSEYMEVWRNRITTRGNAGVRVENSNYVSVHDNVIEGFDRWDGGGPGIEVVRDDRSALPMNQIYIYYNTLHDTFGPGIYIVASGTYDKEDLGATVRNNVLYKTGLNYSIFWVGAIVTSGFYNLNIENNTIDHAYNFGILAAITANNVSYNDFEIIVKNNIIFKTQKRRNSDGNIDHEQHGFGIHNLAPDTHTIIVSYNDVWYNMGGDIIGHGIELGEGNISMDPKVVDEVGHDYHLKEGSPAIDAGAPTSNFNKEPDPNGGRIDMGRYGNTIEAGAGHTGFASAISTHSGSDGMSSETATNVYSGDGGQWSEETNTPVDLPSYWDPGKAVTDASLTTAVVPAKVAAQQALESIFDALGSSPSSATDTCTKVDEPGGLIPCGRNTDSNFTTWNECRKCDLCGIVLMCQLCIEFMVKLAAVAANLSIIIAGFLYIFAAGRTNLIAQSKLIVKYTLLGFIVVFAAWLIVDGLLSLFGYIDPMGGEWYTMC